MKNKSLKLLVLFFALIGFLFTITFSLFLFDPTIIGATYAN
jgi:hypothetical protein